MATVFDSSILFLLTPENHAMRVAVAIELTDKERATLTKWSRGRSTPARLVLRAKIVLLAAAGRQNKQIARQLGCKRETVGRWRNRFAQQRLAGIQQDAPRPGHTPTARLKHEAEILRKTTQETPPQATHWSTRTLARALGTSRDTVQRVWRDHGLKPHLSKTLKSPTIRTSPKNWWMSWDFT